MLTEGVLCEGLGVGMAGAPDVPSAVDEGQPRGAPVEIIEVGVCPL